MMFWWKEEDEEKLEEGLVGFSQREELMQAYHLFLSSYRGFP